MSNDGPNLFIPSIARSEGNASQEVKEKLATIWSQFVEGPAFANTVARRVEVTEMSITPKAEEPKKVEARVVLELDVTGGESESQCRLTPVVFLTRLFCIHGVANDEQI